MASVQAQVRQSSLHASAPQPLDDGEDVLDEVVQVARRVLPRWMLGRAPPRRVCGCGPCQRRCRRRMRRFVMAPEVEPVAVEGRGKPPCLGCNCDALGRLPSCEGPSVLPSQGQSGAKRR